jgi:pimeloyl-ACP methyl ester carboxylesterase
MLHGLAGHSGEWQGSAQWLVERHRVFALDQRGHGRSERRPADVSRDAYVADAVAAIDRFDLAPVVLVGQSLGGHTAFLVAARRPDVVKGLVVAEASAGGPDRDAPARTREALAAWPVPFSSRMAALQFFGGHGAAARSWVDGLEHRQDGLWPRFEVDVMVESLREVADRSYWSEWDQIECPTLVVRAEHGTLPRAEAENMERRLAGARLVEISGAGHDLHLDSPERWRESVERFMEELA